MKKKYSGAELLQATRDGLIKDGSKFTCKAFPKFVFVYDGCLLPKNDLSNYWVMQDGMGIDRYLVDIISNYDLNKLTFKLINHKPLRLFMKQLICRHDWEDWSNLPGCQTFKCSKCDKEIAWNPWEGFHDIK